MPFGHHLSKIPIAKRISEVPTDAKNNNLIGKVSPSKQRWPISDHGFSQYQRHSSGLQHSPATHARHYLEWIEACKGGKPASYNFDFGSQLTEICLLGVAAQRSGKYLKYDTSEMRFTNDADANQYLSEQYRQGWTF
jgi:Oxidoreductase family, C-terminal alpha/beta domain